jgi:hypothetical protein
MLSHQLHSIAVYSSSLDVQRKSGVDLVRLRWKLQSLVHDAFKDFIATNTSNVQPLFEVVYPQNHDELIPTLRALEPEASVLSTGYQIKHQTALIQGIPLIQLVISTVVLLKAKATKQCAFESSSSKRRIPADEW